MENKRSPKQGNNVTWKKWCDGIAIYNKQDKYFTARKSKEEENLIVKICMLLSSYISIPLPFFHLIFLERKLSHKTYLVKIF